MTTIPPKPARTSSDRLIALAPIGDDETRVADVEEPRFPARVGDADDHALVTRHLRLVTSELRDLVEVVRGVVAPAIKRIEERQQETDLYLDQLGRSLHTRLDEIVLKLSAVGDR